MAIITFAMAEMTALMAAGEGDEDGARRGWGETNTLAYGRKDATHCKYNARVCSKWLFCGSWYAALIAQLDGGDAV